MTPKVVDSLEQLLSDAEKVDGWLYAITTDKLKFDYWNSEATKREGRDWIESNKKRLLELRIFSEEAEYKAFRGDIGHDLRFREIGDDEEQPDENYFDEDQFLDINIKTASKETDDKKMYSYASDTEDCWEVRTTTGGGPYTVPLENLDNACIIVRNYLKYYDDSGQAYVSDFRLVELLNKESKNTGEGNKNGTE